MTAVGFFCPQLAIELAYAYIGIPAVIILDPFDLLFRVCVWMLAVRAM
jgi:hypothetical protein